MLVSRNDLMKRGAQLGAVAAIFSTVGFILFWWLATLPQTLVPVVRIPDWIAIGVFLISAGLVLGLIFSIPLGVVNGAIIGYVLLRLMRRPKPLHPRAGLIVGAVVPFISIFIIGPLNGEVVLPFYTFDPFFNWMTAIWVIAYALYLASGAWVGYQLQYRLNVPLAVTLSLV
ncbi:MAG: hypothetical protein KIH69_016185 [Anaerolineae bacterium]|nr:hypothetical protein [Anaerolineae bacterium]